MERLAVTLPHEDVDLCKLLDAGSIPIVVHLHAADVMSQRAPPPWCGVVPRSSLLLCLRKVLLDAFEDELPIVGDEEPKLWLREETVEEALTATGHHPSSPDSSSHMSGTEATSGNGMDAHSSPFADDAANPAPGRPTASLGRTSGAAAASGVASASRRSGPVVDGARDYVPLSWALPIGVIADKTARYRFDLAPKLPIVLIAHHGIATKLDARGVAVPHDNVALVTSDRDASMLVQHALKASLAVLFRDTRPYVLMSPEEVNDYQAFAMCADFVPSVSAAHTNVVDKIFQSGGRAQRWNIVVHVKDTALRVALPVLTSSAPRADDTVSTADRTSREEADQTSLAAAASDAAEPPRGPSASTHPQPPALVLGAEESLLSLIERAAPPEEWSLRRGVVVQGLPQEVLQRIPASWAMKRMCAADLTLHAVLL